MQRMQSFYRVLIRLVLHDISQSLDKMENREMQSGVSCNLSFNIHQNQDQSAQSIQTGKTIAGLAILR